MREYEGKPLVKKWVNCRNGCKTREARFQILFEPDEEPQNIYLCNACKKYGHNGKDMLSVANARETVDYVFENDWRLLKGKDLERAKRECTPIDQIPIPDKRGLGRKII